MIISLATILAVRNNQGDDGGWMQLLVFVIIAVIYAIGSLIKSRAGTTDLEEEQEQEKREHPQKETPQKPRYRPLTNLGLSQQRPYGAAHKPLSPPDVTTVPQPRPPRAVPAPPKLIQKSSEPIKVKLPEPKPVLQPLPAERIVPTPQHVQKPVTPPAPEGKKHEIALVQSLLSSASPDTLRSAILYYEILGKPLGLRHAAEFPRQH